MISTRTTMAALTITALTLGACGGGSDDATPDTAATAATPESATDSSPAGLRLVAPMDAAETITDASDDLVILDVRTPEEFAEGHIDGAIMIDFYRDDFADELAKLDPEVPYVLYCRSGNRSGQTVAIMDTLGFTSVDDVDGGVIAWQDAGLPLVTD